MVYTFPEPQPQVLEEPVYPAMIHHVKDADKPTSKSTAMNNLYILINNVV